MRSAILPEKLPACEIPERSPFTSARKTGTPSSLNASASLRNVTVYPVPVAPAIKPWRFAILATSEIVLPEWVCAIASVIMCSFSF